MPIVSIYTDILAHIHTDDWRSIADHVVRIGDSITFRDEDLGIAFRTGGRRSDEQAILICEYRGLMG